MRISKNTLIKFFFISATIGVGISYSKLYLFHLIFLLVFIYYFSGKLNILKVILPTRFFIMLPAMFTWFLATILWSLDRQASFLYVTYLLIGTGIVFIAVTFARDMQKQEFVYQAIALVVCTEIVASLLECTGYFRLPISPFSNYLQYFGRDGADVKSIEQSLLVNYLHTPCGFEWNPNNLACKMVIVLPFFLFLKKSWLRLFGIIGVIVLIAFSGSRGAVLAATFELIVFFILFKKHNFILLLRNIIVILLILILMKFTGINFSDISFINDSFSAIFAYINPESINSADSIGIRQQLIANGLDALWNTYGLGVGGGADVSMQIQYDNTFYDNNYDSQTTSMHNFWVELLVNGGLLFFVFFAIWYCRMTYQLFKISMLTKNNRLKYFSAASFLALMGFSIAVISTSSAIYFLPMYLLYGFSIATINNYYRIKNQEMVQY